MHSADMMITGEVNTDYAPIERQDSNEAHTNNVADKEQKIREELKAIRDLAARNNIDDRAERKELNKTVQKRLRGFIERGWKQAAELIKPENNALLTALLAEVNQVAAASTPKKLEQIAFVQMCVKLTTGKKKDTWDVPARRHERIGRIYRVLHKNAWPAEGLDVRLRDYKGGISRLLEDHKPVDPRAEALKATRRKRVLRDGDAASLPASYKEEAEGTWAFALVSLVDGKMVVHTTVPMPDATVDKAVDAYCAHRAPEMAVEAEERAEQVA